MKSIKLLSLFLLALSANAQNCGMNVGLTCGTAAEPCCSSFGWCGNTTLHCQSGCQATYSFGGKCVVPGGNAASPAPAASAPLIPKGPITGNNQLGTWQVIGHTGIAAMHIVLTSPTKILIIDKAEPNPSAITSDGLNAHSVEYDLNTNLFRVLDLKTNTFCSAGSFLGNGTLLETGGAESTPGDYKSASGFQTVRQFTPCMDGSCDWLEWPTYLNSARWYNGMVTLPDGRVFILGGSTKGTGVNKVSISNPTFEFYPKDKSPPGVPIQFLIDTFPYNLYPVIHVVPGPATQNTLFLFANNKAVLWDYVTETEITKLPDLPGPPRSYPLTGTSVLLPLDYKNGYTPVVMICGGSTSMSTTSPAADSCGRINLASPNPQWEMDSFGGFPRVLPDCVFLADGTVMCLNGGEVGYAGYARKTRSGGHSYLANKPVLTPVLYNPNAKSWTQLFPTTIPRMYHSSVTLVPDGSVFVSGSNPNSDYFPQGIFPTEYRAERFVPPYLLTTIPQPVITAVAGSTILNSETPIRVKYGTKIIVTATVSTSAGNPQFTAALMNHGFSTHSQHMSMRYVKIKVKSVTQAGNVFNALVEMPPNGNIMPPGRVYLYLLNKGKPAKTAVEVFLQA
ncbi:5661_t:CDS:2 [Paraglomus occultum]|uniref:5661_t:CDS:1 n=1 Tax=Paraglomus occultum TaxID=144539 RepID=A0A9N9CXS0_9GLOM|nr:5661_t:CDS:2 [Paraglomus occultum]